MGHTKERDWTTEAGLRAVCLLTDMGHRCGYVEVPEGHPLHGCEYNQPTPAIVCDLDDITVGNKSLVLALMATVGAMHGEDLRRSPDVCFDVHGGLTYSGGGDGYPADGDGWWFGFDYAHAGDRTRGSTYGVLRSESYVVSECERLARQIVDMVPTEPEHATP